jgi:hypothetical protein
MPKSYKPDRIFHLRSEDALIKGQGDFSTTELYYNIDQNLTPEQDEALVVSVNSAEIPYSYFPVNSNNKTLKFFESSDATAGNLSAKNDVVLTAGEYNGDELATELQRAIRASNGRNDYTVAFNPATTKLTITQPTDIAFRFDFTNSAKYAYSLLGFEYAVKTATDNGGNHTLESDTAINIAGDNAIYIRSPLSNINTYESRHGGISDILAKIPIKVNYNEIIYYEPLVYQFKSQLPAGQPLNDLTIRLTNKYNELIDLNGLDWEFSLTVSTVNV